MAKGRLTAAQRGQKRVQRAFWDSMRDWCRANGGLMGEDLPLESVLPPMPELPTWAGETVATEDSADE